MSDDPTRADHGANAPPPPKPLTMSEIDAFLSYALDSLIARRTEMHEALAAMLQAYPSIESDEQLADFAENRRMAEALLRTAEDRRKEQKKPYLDGERAVDAWFASLTAPLRTPLQDIRARMDAYGRIKLAAEQAKAREAARQRAIEADRAAEAARRIEAERRRPGRAELFPDDPVVETAQRVAAQAEDAARIAEAQANATPADYTRTRGTFGAVTSMRTTLDFAVTDFNAVPRAFLEINRSAVLEFGRSCRRPDGTPNEDIPGIQWTVNRSMAVR